MDQIQFNEVWYKHSNDLFHILKYGMTIEKKREIEQLEKEKKETSQGGAF